MSITCTVTPGQTYGANYTVDYPDLNKLGNPAVVVPDGGALAFGVGAVATPSISFAGDTDTGFYQPTVGELAVAANGVQVLRFTGDGLVGNVRAGNGTSAVPSIAFASDTDTGLYLAAANTLGVAGALALADGTAGAPALAFASDLDTGLVHTAANTMVLACGGTAVATVSAAGIDAVGLSIAGIPVGTAGLDFGHARFFDDFHAPAAESGWLLTAAFAGISQKAYGNETRQREGVMRFQLGTNSGSLCCALWPHNPTVTGTTTTFVREPAYLTAFDTTGEFVEIGFRFTSTIGSAGTASTIRLGIGTTGADATYSAPTLSALVRYVAVEFNLATSANLRLVVAGGTSGVQVSTVTAALDTYYRARITRTATGYTLTVNGTVAATLAIGSPIAVDLGRLMLVAGYGAGPGPNLDIDYVQWDCPVTRT